MNASARSNGSLAKINQATAVMAQVKGEIATSRSLGDAKRASAQARAVRALLAESHAACELQLEAREVYILAEANLGKWLKLRDRWRGPNKERESMSSGDIDSRIDNSRQDRCRRLARFNGRLSHLISARRAQIYAEAKRKKRPLTEGGLRPMSVAGILSDAEGTRKERPILRPSDLWSFSPPKYDRPGAKDSGYIAGEVYANILWRWAEPGWLVAEVMAGSGVIKTVYDDREQWLPPGAELDLDLRMFDLNPRDLHQKLIRRHDARKKLPCRPDLIIMDLPYYAIVRGQYGDSPDDLANAVTPEDWAKMVGQVARASRASQKASGRCCVVVASAYLAKDGSRLLTAELAREQFVGAGYRLADYCFFGRGIQGGKNMKFVNADAVKNRKTLSEMTHVMMFQIGS
jgi:hypothetical protein